jgi:hypothetical protein
MGNTNTREYCLHWNFVDIGTLLTLELCYDATLFELLVTEEIF